MKLVTLKLTTKELEVLTTLVSDQLFRKEFIDPKMPGYKKNPEQVQDAESALSVLKESVKAVMPFAKHDPNAFHLAEKNHS